MNFGGQPLKITEIVNSNKALEIKLDSDEPIAPHKGVNLRAFLDPKKAGKGKIDEEIFLMTDSPLSASRPLRSSTIIGNRLAGMKFIP